MPRTELYIGNLNRDVSRKDIESVFDKYGRLLRCDVKNKGYGSVYAFLEFDEERDAQVYLSNFSQKIIASFQIQLLCYFCIFNLFEF